MICPLCGSEMQEGGIIAESISTGWVPLEQFQKKGIKRLVYTNFRAIGKPNVLLGQTKIPNAYFCRDCDKVVGIFEFREKLFE